MKMNFSQCKKTKNSNYYCIAFLVRVQSCEIICFFLITAFLRYNKM